MNADKEQVIKAQEMLCDLMTSEELIIFAVQLKNQLGVLYTQRDVVLKELVNRNATQAVEFPEGSGEFWRLQDNFSADNKSFHTTSFNRFDVKAVKKEKPGKE